MSEPTSSSSNSSNSGCPNGKVRIFIRSPTIPSLEGFSILISLDSSVLTLKQAILESHPLKPIVSDQKLIYRGRVLNDSDTIINILRDGLETDQTFHLVIKPSFQTITETSGIPISSPNSVPSSIPSSQQQRIRFPQGYTSTSPNTQPPDQNNRPNGTADSALQNPYNYYNYQYPYPAMQQDNSQQPLSIPSIPSIPFNQNLFPMGQYYYVMINGMPYLAPIQYLYQYPYQQVQPPQIGQIGQIGVHAPQPFAAQVQDPPQDAGARNQRRASTFLLILKLIFLVYIFSQNASAERMILLYICALVIFLYQTGRLRIVRRRRQRFIVPLNELFAQQPQVPIVQQNQEAQPNVEVNSNNIGTSPEQSSPSSAQNNNSSNNNNNNNNNNNHSNNNNNNNNNNSAGNINSVAPSSSSPSSPSSSSDQQNNNNNNNNNDVDDINDINEAQPRVRENARSITLQDIEHGVWTFITSLIPTNTPDVGQQEDVGM
ncbi:hypothetical protein Glove_406g55 [Diversispora epigaea]|uniref:Ubiquitin-like domain-containing protein n=1 Tax=Diversispora epigaea TaxID=1348612 RepID=A0A397H2Z7_9GLOM|nr:hypothetical protein Glove_406g55 [Diversispora epigaea]